MTTTSKVVERGPTIGEVRLPAISTNAEVVFVEAKAIDPYIGPCPKWCENAERGHTVESMDEDRNRYGPVTSSRFEG